MRVIRYAANDVNIGKANEEVVDFLKQHKVNHHLVFEYQLLIEEILIKLVEKAPMGAEFEISASFARGHCTFMITCAGAPVDLFYHDSLGSIILDEYSERISQNYSKNKNRIKLSTHVSSNSLMINSCVAVLAAVLVSLVFRYIVPDNITLYLEGQLIFPLMNVFTMLMETFAYPLAFLSIVAYIVSFRMQIDGNREISNMAIKHTLTSIIGLIIGGAVGSVARFIPEIYDMTEFRTRTNNFMGEDLAEVIGNAVPSNMVEPFTGSSSLPVLLLAVIFGIAASSYFGRGGDFIRELISGAAGLMGTVINITYSLMPIIVFLAVLSGIIDFGYKILVFLIVTLFAFIFALALMVAVQLIILAASGMGPVRFFKEYRELIIGNFNIASAIDALSFNKRNLCRKLDESPQMIREKLDLGATMDMDGNCVVVAMGIVSLVSVCRMDMGLSDIIGLLVIILVLSFGAPNRPGSFLLCMLLLMNFVGVSTDIGAIIIFLELFTSKLCGFVNVFGNITAIVADNQNNARRQKRKRAGDEEELET